MTSSRDDDVITAAAAARYRLRQLVHQHPPHDSDVKYCVSLISEAEKDELASFDRERRQHQLGRADFFTMTSDNVSCCTRCRQVRQLQQYSLSYVGMQYVRCPIFDIQHLPDGPEYNIIKGLVLGRTLKVHSNISPTLPLNFTGVKNVKFGLDLASAFVARSNVSETEI